MQQVKGQRASARLAKLTRPRVNGALARPRLFDMFEDALDRPIIWVTGPAGSGKSTLASTYLERIEGGALWYDIDHSDGEPTSFFHYLQVAIAGDSADGRAALPQFAREHLSDIDGFSRRFFQRFFAHIALPGVVVFDNFHEIPEDSEVQQAFDVALSCIPQGLRVVVLSREAPPASIIRHVANSRLAAIDWPDLRLTLDETRSIVERSGEIAEPVVEALFAQSDGWPAGLVLMVEHQRRSGALDRIPHDETMAGVFNYFAAQVFDQLADETQRFLLETSMLRAIDVPLAESLTRRSSAQQILEALYRRYLFTERRMLERASYRYHSLFRSFLLQRATLYFKEEEWHGRVCKAASLLAARGEFEDAFELFAQIRAWPEAADLLAEYGEALIDADRARLVSEWIAVLPQSVVRARARLQFLAGSAFLEIDQPRAEQWLEPAWQAFAAEGDVKGQLQSVAAIVESHYYEMQDYTKLDRWLPVLVSLIPQALPVVGRDVQMRAYHATLFAMEVRQPDHPNLPYIAERLRQLLNEDFKPLPRLAAGGVLLNHYVRTNEAELAQMLTMTLHPLSALPEVPVRRRILWLLQYAIWLQRTCVKLQEATAMLDAVEQLIEDNGFTGSLSHFTLLLNRVRVAMAAQDVDGAAYALLRAETCLARPTRLASYYLNYYKAMLSLRERHAGEALAAGLLMFDMAEEVGVPAVQRAWLTEVVGSALALMGRFDEAADQFDQAAALAAGKHDRIFAAGAFALRAVAARRRESSADSARLLIELMADRRERQDFSFLQHLPDLLAELAGAALESGVEEEYVLELIRRRKLRCPAIAIESWPWPVKVFALRPFAILVDGAPLVFGRKAQKKPLDLLKVILALGGQSVDTARIIQIMWPDAESDGPKSLEATLARLRKLLGDDATVILQEGKLTLNRDMVWTDVWAFESLLAGLAAVDQATPNEGQSAEQIALRAYGLYRSPFLGNEPKSAWAQPMADRLHDQFQKLIVALGQVPEREADWDRAIEIYGRGLAMDNLAETLYQRQMYCYAEKGELANALSVYRRCRDNLSIVLGIAPSRNTREMHDSILRRLG